MQVRWMVRSWAGRGCGRSSTAGGNRQFIEHSRACPYLRGLWQAPAPRGASREAGAAAPKQAHAPTGGWAPRKHASLAQHREHRIQGRTIPLASSYVRAIIRDPPRVSPVRLTTRMSRSWCKHWLAPAPEFERRGQTVQCATRHGACEPGVLEPCCMVVCGYTSKRKLASNRTQGIGAVPQALEGAAEGRGFQVGDSCCRASGACKHATAQQARASCWGWRTSGLKRESRR